MPTGKQAQIVYWDANMFIRLIAGRAKAIAMGQPLVYDAIHETAERVRNKQITLVTSSWTRTEMSWTQMRPEDREIFDGIMRRRNVIDQPYDSPIAELASAIQEQLKRVGKQLSQPDLIHTATAVYHEVDELHTTDGPMKACDGHPVLRGVRILTPVADQSRLF